MLASWLLACADPPAPPPATDAASLARHVEWRADDAPVLRPVALVVDVPGGPLDRIVADPDVTTFLNDRFHPVLRATAPDQAAGTVRFYTADGCPFGPALRPEDAPAFIAAANEVVVQAGARGRSAPRLTTTCSPPASAAPAPAARAPAP